MFLSIIVPVFNASTYLKRCLNSIVSQSYSQIELILIDDCSTDSSLEIIRQYQKVDERIKVFQNLSNKRVGYTRNRGLEHASGDYIWFIDADDWISGGAIQELADVLQPPENNVDLLVFGHTEEHGVLQNESGIITRLPRNPENPDDAFAKFLSLSGGFFSYPFLYLYSRRMLLEHHILFPERMYYEDILFVAKAIRYAENIQVFPKSFYHYNCEQHNSITQSFSKEKILNILAAYDQLYEFLDAEDLLEKYNDQLVMRFLLQGLGTCYQMYQNLGAEVKKDQELRQLLASYLQSDVLSEKSMIYISHLIEELDEREELTKEYHRFKLDVLRDTKANWEFHLE